MKIADIMGTHPICCTPTDTADEAAYLMKLHNVGALPVISDANQRFLEGTVTFVALSSAKERPPALH